MAARSIQHGPAWYVKDVLRLGRWRLGSLDLDVTSQVLNRLVENFRLAKRNGVRVPVVWNHSADARDLVGWIDDLFVRGPELFARFWASQPADVARIGRVNRETSVELVREFVDGLGRRYSPMIAHLGIVQHPVVCRQQPFVRLQWPGADPRAAAARSGSQRLSVRKGNVRTMNNAPLDLASEFNAPANPERTRNLRLGDIAKVVATVNRILKALGSLLLLPDDTKADELPDRLANIAAQMLPTTPESADAGAVVPTDDAESTPVDIDAEVARLRMQLAQTERQLTAERASGRAERERLFVGSVDRMIETGRLTPAERDGVVDAGRTAGFALSLLAPFERLPMGAAFATTPVARRHAEPREPLLHSTPPMTAERAKELARSFAD